MKLNLEPFESTMHGALRYLPLFGTNQVESMKRTVVGLITPHVLTIADLAKRAETGANVDWHVRDAVAKTIDGLGLQYNARDLLSAYIQWLETAAREAGQARQAYASVLQAAAAAAARHLQVR